MKKTTFYVLIIAGLLLSNFGFGAIPSEERSALISLFNGTNGDNWENKTGWKTEPLDTDGFAMPGTEGNWFGITLEEDHVKGISMPWNELSGPIPPELSNLSQLQILELYFNELSGNIPIELCALNRLKTLNIGANKLTGNIPPELSDLKNLEFLSLGLNQFSGAIPPELGNLNNLDILGLNDNQLSGAIPPQFGNLGKLTRLYLEGNQLTGEIPIQLTNLSHLKYINLYYNMLSGEIPSQFGNLLDLEEIDFGSNFLCGVIPPEFGNLTNLKKLNLNFNQLSGGIPPQLGNLSKLEYLYLGNNYLSGVIPVELCALSKLSSLFLTTNHLIGEIPPELGNLSNLYELRLNNNILSGPIPSSFLNLTHLSYLGIGYNCLYASDPALREWLHDNDEDWEDHQNQCGPLITLPTVTTNVVSSLTSTGAVCGGVVISDGGAPITSRGVCWSNSQNPTIDNYRTIDGSGPGTFTSIITGMNPGTIYYLRAYATNSMGTAYGSFHVFVTPPASTFLEVVLSRKILTFGASNPGNITGPQSVRIGTSGEGVLNWSVSTGNNSKWLSFTPSSGTGASTLLVSVDPTGLEVGVYSDQIIITAPNACNSPQAINVTLRVYSQDDSSAPFGDFGTPSDGAAVYNSVPITGWALDNIGISNVKIYNDDTYIGDATFVEGARPDVVTAYPFYPNNHKAGWGYMLLTHFLPNGGNGTYTLIAKATDIEGNETTLGSKTITIDNAHSVKPFGAIDTPTEGGAASGKNFVNFGWALTPQPNTIPIDGSTIDVIVDGVVKGHPKYNVYRSDIASLFPGYANTNGAIGYYYLDTTKLTNGIHTIAWNVTDNAGNSEGIGSRYFSVMNNDGIASSGANADSSNLYPGEGAAIHIEIEELERVEMNILKGQACLSPTSSLSIEGYSVVGDEFRELPIGSTLDTERGVFYWQPGPGFVGEYRLLFIIQNQDGNSVKQDVTIMITPKFSK